MPPHRPLLLTSDLITRSHPHKVEDDPSAIPLASEEELSEALDAMLTKSSTPNELRVFAYGSLMWKSEFEFADHQIATLRGWHRRFCLWQYRFRGTHDKPGVMLALDRGGSCVGIVYRITGPDLEAKIMPVWRREMRGRGYRARWVSVETAQGRCTALTFVANRDGERYAGRLSDEEIADRIALACGHIGPSAEYLLNTVVHCEELGIHDRHLWRMQALVAERLSTEERRSAETA